MTKAVQVGKGLEIGNGSFAIISGPCSVENREQMEFILSFHQKWKLSFLRGGIFKPRTNPKSFQGLGYEGLELIRELKRQYDFLFVSEITDVRDIDLFEEVIDIFQVGSRNMQNYVLLKELGHSRKPVILKRGMSATISEWIQASEYISLGGNENIIFCERGIRTFDHYTRNFLDIMSVPIIHKETPYPVIVDPSHAIGISELVPFGAIAAKAIGADGLILEIHPDPASALSDGMQSLDLQSFENLLSRLI